MFKVTGALLIAMFGIAAAAHAATVEQLPPTPPIVVQQAIDAQKNVCRDHAVCVNATDSAPVCLPLESPIWACQGGVRRSDEECAVVTNAGVGRAPVTYQTCWAMPLLLHKAEAHRVRAWHLWRRAWSATTF